MGNGVVVVFLVEVGKRREVGVVAIVGRRRKRRETTNPTAVALPLLSNPPPLSLLHQAVATPALLASIESSPAPRRRSSLPLLYNACHRLQTPPPAEPDSKPPKGDAELTADKSSELRACTLRPARHAPKPKRTRVQPVASDCHAPPLFSSPELLPAKPSLVDVFWMRGGVSGFLFGCFDVGTAWEVAVEDCVNSNRRIPAKFRQPREFSGELGNVLWVKPELWILHVHH
ncbi:hypothetical protein Tsubulata_018255 [Turnera subulata]|uniref:Uncharacterized protein n=1 Tax=Turnera subulata TaxID=218843 RepID=A0A9Q0JA83_9ROSI|nr:hypothetical protein Tsubulata_018255 [Turnera subulata]